MISRFSCAKLQQPVPGRISPPHQNFGGRWGQGCPGWLQKTLCSHLQSESTSDEIQAGGKGIDGVRGREPTWREEILVTHPGMMLSCSEPGPARRSRNGLQAWPKTRAHSAACPTAGTAGGLTPFAPLFPRVVRPHRAVHDSVQSGWSTRAARPDKYLRGPTPSVKRPRIRTQPQHRRIAGHKVEGAPAEPAFRTGRFMT